MICDSLGILMIPNLIFAVVLAIVYYRIYFDRDLKNHKYIAWYWTWFLLAMAELLIFQHAHLQGSHIEGIYVLLFYLTKLLSTIVIFKAATSFEGATIKTNHIVIFIVGFILHIAGAYNNIHLMVALGSIPKLAVFLYNFKVLDKEEYRALRLPLLIGWIGWAILEFKTFFHGACGIYIVVSNTLFLLTGLVILGIHLYRLQRERDFYKLEACELSTQMQKINKLEKNLMQYVDLIGEHHD